MFVIIGIVIVFGAVCAGYLLEHGPLAVLLQPAELLIIGGAGIGTILIANPLHIVKKIISNLVRAFRGSSITKENYVQSLYMMFEILTKARKDGLVAVEKDIESPKESQIFSKYNYFLSNHHALHFVCDTLKVVLVGGVDPFDLDQMMELDMEVHHEEESQPVTALATVADSLPGLGIVAAVLGVVVTMGALGGPPEQIGHKVAAALVGTFLGILLCYGLVSPLSSNMTKRVEEDRAMLHVLRVVILAFIKGMSPIMAVEMARRAVPHRVRPTFQELESVCRGGGNASKAKA